MIEEVIVENNQHRPRHYIPESAIGGGRLYSGRIGLFVPAWRGPAPQRDPGQPRGQPREGPPQAGAGRPGRPPAPRRTPPAFGGSPPPPFAVYQPRPPPAACGAAR